MLSTSEGYEGAEGIPIFPSLQGPEWLSFLRFEVQVTRRTQGVLA
jgi:hypothetical protein